MNEAAPTTTLAPLLADLAAEQAAVDALVVDLADGREGWDRPTPAAGWAVRHQVAHLAFFDQREAMAVTDPAAFEAERDAMLAAPVLDTVGPLATLAGAELLAVWRTARDDVQQAFAGLDPRARLPWYGPPMSARSALTARLMETWAHGTDVADALGAALPVTDRLRHVAHLGVVTRGWSHLVRGLEPDTAEVRVELTPPTGGEPWTWGPVEADDRIVGPALDWCLVVTQRRHPSETALAARGPAAEAWLAVAQAFAGAPTESRPGRVPSPG